jgi:hypothetical protein
MSQYHAADWAASSGMPWNSSSWPSFAFEKVTTPFAVVHFAVEISAFDSLMAAHTHAKVEQVESEQRSAQC